MEAPTSAWGRFGQLASRDRGQGGVGYGQAEARDMALTFEADRPLLPWLTSFVGQSVAVRSESRPEMATISAPGLSSRWAMLLTHAARSDE